MINLSKDLQDALSLINTADALNLDLSQTIDRSREFIKYMSVEEASFRTPKLSKSECNYLASITMHSFERLYEIFGCDIKTQEEEEEEDREKQPSKHFDYFCLLLGSLVTVTVTITSTLITCSFGRTLESSLGLIIGVSFLLAPVIRYLLRRD